MKKLKKQELMHFLLLLPTHNLFFCYVQNLHKPSLDAWCYFSCKMKKKYKKDFV